MRVAGIICECNPLHGGHLYLMEQARADGADAVVCVMSGCFTQRGEAAVFDPRTRAEMILAEGGADAVFEFPFPYSAAGAEQFALAGVSILQRLGVDELWFGSECGELALLQRCAEIACSDAFLQAYRERCRLGASGTAESYFALLREMGGMDMPLSNDILGIAYLKAILTQNASMKAVTVKRLGSAYREKALTVDSFPSATALRRLIAEEGVSALGAYASDAVMTLARRQTENGCAPADLALAERAILARFRLISTDALESIPELSGGLGRRMAEISSKVETLEDLIGRSVTKKYTEARVRRGILFAMTGVEEFDLKRIPAYAVLLAANRTGCRFLSERKKSREIGVVTCHGDLPDTPDAKRQEELTHRAFALYGLMLPQVRSVESFLRCSSVMKFDSDS
ncbi:MAG: nucleotidyltransferase family protein [Clostridia bacterium]|nr:nucleotidyltransferase family protein [Clostridia bacterium]